MDSILEAVIGSTSDAIITADAEGLVVTWNPAAEKIFGFSQEEVLGQPMTLFMPEQFRAAHDAGIARVTSTGKTKVMGQALPLIGLHKDGHEFPIELSLATWEMEGTRYFSGIIRDVSEREKLAGELAQSEELMRAIMNSASDTIICADEYGKVVLWNPVAEKMLGHSAEDMIGEPLTAIIPERFRDGHEAGIKRLRMNGEQRVIGHSVELHALHKDGHEIPIELSLGTWLTGNRRYFSGIIRDVSEREKLTGELTQSEERMRAIMTSASDTIICADEWGKVVLWNPVAEKMLGHSAEDMMGQPLTAIIPERFRDGHEAGIKRMRMNEDPHVIDHTVELFAVHKAGHEIPIELSLGTWLTGNQRYFSGIIRDITERKKAEADIQAANRELDDKNHQLNDLSVKLAKYLSKQVYDSIFSGRKDVRVESYRKNLTIFFSDIQGFTELTDHMEAETLSNLLNQYLGEMSAIAEEFGGTIDKFIGDGIMIFFGDPDSLGEKEDALACVKMALAMRQRVRQLGEEWIDEGITEQLHVRIGINTGFCTVGNFGSDDRLDYTIVGGQVNATSRLETAAAPDQVLISHATYALIK
ncbi:MAG: PAS domain S-box protein, partial [Rhodospirillaceae bacterium]|nr:PAS domain S-box protein [Rhodospirillaceae bacterium]